MSETNVVAEPGRQEFIVTRVYNAPRERVFKAITDPALIPRWWGPRFVTTEVAAMDVRPGGRWQFVQRDAAGSEYIFHGYYHLVEPPIRMVQTFQFDGMPGHVFLETITLEDQDGRTLLTDQSVFQSAADRDAMNAEDIEGVKDSMDRLAELL